MTFWEEDENRKPVTVSNEIVDISFRIQCKALPVDHGWDLGQAIVEHLPWLPHEPTAALHQILVAESGNGWLSPEDGNALLYPSRRTKLTLRLPEHRVNEVIATLDKQTIHLSSGSTILLSNPEGHPLSRLTTIYTRFAIFHDGESEEQFLDRIHQQLAARDIHLRKMVCGRKNILKMGDKIVVTRSLMLAELTPKESITLQQRGLDEGKDFGCGLFLPHKTVENRLSEND